MVNRVWLHLFGRGLVPTPDNFGAAGQPPSQPAAARPPGRLVRGERLVGQEADPPDRAQPGLPARLRGSTPRNYEADPDNVLVWRMSKRRLEGRGAARRDAGGQRPARPCDAPRARSSPGRATAMPTVAPLARGRPADDQRNVRSVYLPVDAGQSPRSAGRCSTSPTRAWSTGAAGDDDGAGAGAVPAEQPVRHPPGRRPPPTSSWPRPTATATASGSGGRTCRSSAGPPTDEEAIGGRGVPRATLAPAPGDDRGEAGHARRKARLGGVLPGAVRQCGVPLSKLIAVAIVREHRLSSGDRSR